MFVCGRKGHLALATKLLSVPPSLHFEICPNDALDRSFLLELIIIGILLLIVVTCVRLSVKVEKRNATGGNVVSR